MPVRVQDPYRIGVSCSLGRNISAYWTWVSYSLCLCPSGRKTPIRLGSPISWSHSPLLVPCASLAPLRQYSRFSFVHAARKNSSYLRMIENSNFFQLLIIFSTLNRISNCCKRFSCRNKAYALGFHASHRSALNDGANQGRKPTCQTCINIQNQYCAYQVDIICLASVPDMR